MSEVLLILGHKFGSIKLYYHRSYDLMTEERIISSSCSVSRLVSLSSSPLTLLLANLEPRKIWSRPFVFDIFWLLARMTGAVRWKFEDTTRQQIFGWILRQTCAESHKILFFLGFYLTKYPYVNFSWFLTRLKHWIKCQCNVNSLTY